MILCSKVKGNSIKLVKGLLNEYRIKNLGLFRLGGLTSCRTGHDASWGANYRSALSGTGEWTPCKGYTSVPTNIFR